MEILIPELVELIAEMVGFDGEVEWDVSKPNGQTRRRLDTSWASKWFNWEVSTGFEDGLRYTIDWNENQ